MRSLPTCEIVLRETLPVCLLCSQTVHWDWPERPGQADSCGGGETGPRTPHLHRLVPRLGPLPLGPCRQEHEVHASLDYIHILMQDKVNILFICVIKEINSVCLINVFPMAFFFFFGNCDCTFLLPHGGAQPACRHNFYTDNLVKYCTCWCVCLSGAQTVEIWCLSGDTTEEVWTTR